MNSRFASRLRPRRASEMIAELLAHHHDQGLREQAAVLLEHLRRVERIEHRLASAAVDPRELSELTDRVHAIMNEVQQLNLHSEFRRCYRLPVSAA